ncbi:MAG: exo-alpha-sialidase [Actinobacteria bacterium]|nr:MAG: exo-alpha-sialidase [Actinomycetota bacterium]
MTHNAARRGASPVVVALVAVLIGIVPSGARAAPKASFVNFEVAGTPPNPNPPPGAVCPQSTPSITCTNFAAEPAIDVADDGTFFGSSENGLGGGTDAWKATSTDARHFVELPSPNQTSATQDTGFGPGGGDTDIAVATATNASGRYNVYVSSLTLANVDVSTSTDGGASWSLNPVGATIPGDDRPWIAAVGARKACVSYHDVATFRIHVNCSSDAGTTFTQLGEAIDADHAFLTEQNQIGNLVISRTGGNAIYQIMVGPTDAEELVTCGTPAGPPSCYRTVWLAVSTDGGQTFTDRKVYTGGPDQSFNHNFPNVAVDRAGNAYVAFSDNHDVYFSFSTNGGATWTQAVGVNKAGANTAIFPWLEAGASGKVDLVYYGSSYFDGINPPDSYPDGAAWFVYIAQNLRATTPGSSFSQTQASPVVHYGGVCEGGISCTGNRDLYDDFGVAASPVTGMASIIYSDDQYSNTASAPAPPGCTPGRTNSPSCDHTMIAAQTAGKGIF